VAQLTDRLSDEERSRLSLHEQIVDRLSDLMLDTEELIDVIGRPESRHYDWIEGALKSVFDTVNDLMKRLTD
jgi:hypothetical protein